MRSSALNLICKAKTTVVWFNVHQIVNLLWCGQPEYSGDNRIQGSLLTRSTFSFKRADKLEHAIFEVLQIYLSIRSAQLFASIKERYELWNSDIRFAKTITGLIKILTGLIKFSRSECKCFTELLDLIAELLDKERIRLICFIISRICLHVLLSHVPKFRNLFWEGEGEGWERVASSLCQRKCCREVGKKATRRSRKKEHQRKFDDDDDDDGNNNHDGNCETTKYGTDTSDSHLNGIRPNVRLVVCPTRPLGALGQQTNHGSITDI